MILPAIGGMAFCKSLDLQRRRNSAIEIRDRHHSAGRPAELALSGGKAMKPARVITISREYGSGGAAIGQQLARHLGWKLLDRELIDELARRAHMPPSEVMPMDERPSSAIARALKSFWIGNYYGWSTPPSDVTDQDYLVRLTKMVILEAAKLGRCVIVGRGAQCVLSDQEDAFHVFVYGSIPAKLKRIQVRDAESVVTEAVLNEVDRLRAAYLRQYYKVDWMNPHLYHAMLNSDLGVDRVVSVILAVSDLVPAHAHTAAASLTTRR